MKICLHWAGKAVASPSIFPNGAVPHLWKCHRAPQTIRQGKALWPLDSLSEQHSHRQQRQERWLVQKGNYGASHNDTEEACVITPTAFYHSAVINYHPLLFWFIPLFITYSYIQEKLSFPSGINQKEEELVVSRWMIKDSVCLPRCGVDESRARLAGQGLRQHWNTRLHYSTTLVKSSTRCFAELYLGWKHSCRCLW